MKMHFVFVEKVFSDFKLKMAEVPPSSYFRVVFINVCRIVANNMALESLKKCETFLYILFLLIHYGFMLVLKMVKNVFLP